MSNFVGFNLKARPGENVQVFNKENVLEKSKQFTGNDKELGNAIEKLLKKCDQVAVITRDASRGGGVIGFRAIKRKR